MEYHIRIVHNELLVEGAVDVLGEDAELLEDVVPLMLVDVLHHDAGTVGQVATFLLLPVGVEVDVHMGDIGILELLFKDRVHGFDIRAKLPDDA
eukprot:2243072-Amphidinium_carterae.1